MIEKKQSLLQFPCHFTIKVIGATDPLFKPKVLATVYQFFSDFQQKNLSSRPSKEGKFISLSIAIDAQSQQQLDALYQALTELPEVLVAL